MKTTGIYIIKSKIKPERVYIGSAISIIQRWRDHISTLKRNIHRCPILQNHINKYGVKDLEFSILEECIIDNLLEREQYYLDTLKPFFNVLKVAGSPIGHKHSEYTKSIMNISKIGTHHSEETKRKISEAHKGKKLSEKTKKIMSEQRKGNKFSLGRKATDETKAKLSLIHKGCIPWNTGLKGVTKFSDETKKRMSDARKKWHEINKLKQVS